MNKVMILLSTYNGERFLEAQLQSLVNQQGVEVNIFVRDDGSNDSTIEILNRWQQRGSLRWYTGENLRPAKSFMNLIKNAPDADYYAFCDQDDVWMPDKLSSAIAKLKEFQEEIPTLYFSQTTLVNEKLQPLPTPKIHPLCTFYESLILNYATGCTFVFNKRLLEFARVYEPSFLWMHDVWLYKLCISIGGKVYFDPVSHIKYRQHNKNVIGLSGSWKKKLKLKYLRSFNKECERSNTFKELYSGYHEYILSEFKPVIKHICCYKHSFLSMLSLIFNHRIRCKKWQTNLSMRIALLLHTY